MKKTVVNAGQIRTKHLPAFPGSKQTRIQPITTHIFDRTKMASTEQSFLFTKFHPTPPSPNGNPQRGLAYS